MGVGAVRLQADGAGVDRPSPMFLDRLKEFKNMFTVLFDVASQDMSGIVPTDALFLDDQRDARAMYIGAKDVVSMSTMTNRMKRKSEEAKRQKDERKRRLLETKGDSSTDSSNASSSDDTGSTDDDRDFCYTERSTTCTSRVQGLPSVSREADRFGISSRAAAAIATATLEDCHADFTAEAVIDCHKIRRERRSLQRALQTKSIAPPIEGLYFDGRIDDSLERDDVTKNVAKVREDHYVLVEEPKGKYLSHVTPQSGSAKSIHDAITEHCNTNRISITNLKVVGCDGTNTNTGKHGGVIRLLEETLQSPLQWQICMLHINELPFRHLITAIDGPTSGPRGFSGEIGKQITVKLTHMEVIDFEIIQDSNFLSLDESVVASLSTDQKYLYQVTNAITSGTCSSSFAHVKPGKVSHSRWLTVANRVCRLYISTPDPTAELVHLVTHIVRAYAPCWFQIKQHSGIKDGAPNLHAMVSRSRYLAPEYKAVIDPILQRNAFNAHPENVLVAMITDGRLHIRELGVRRIMKARQLQCSDIVRKFVVPDLVLDSKEYYDMIDWGTGSVPVTEPPLVSGLSDGSFRGLIDNPQAVAFDYPCHTQAVERMVKVVTEVSTKVVGFSARHWLILSKLEARSQRPRFNTKKDYITS